MKPNERWKGGGMYYEGEEWNIYGGDKKHLVLNKMYGGRKQAILCQYSVKICGMFLKENYHLKHIFLITEAQLKIIIISITKLPCLGIFQKFLLFTFKLRF